MQIALRRVADEEAVASEQVAQRALHLGCRQQRHLGAVDLEQPLLARRGRDEAVEPRRARRVEHDAAQRRELTVEGEDWRGGGGRRAAAAAVAQSLLEAAPAQLARRGRRAHRAAGEIARRRAGRARLAQRAQLRDAQSARRALRVERWRSSSSRMVRSTSAANSAPKCRRPACHAHAPPAK